MGGGMVHTAHIGGECSSRVSPNLTASGAHRPGILFTCGDFYGAFFFFLIFPIIHPCAMAEFGTSAISERDL